MRSSREIVRQKWLLGRSPYTTFCDRYREWLGRRGLVMRQVHVAGDKAFVDYSGKKARIVDAATGEIVEVELFVAVLGASNLTYADPCGAGAATWRASSGKATGRGVRSPPRSPTRPTSSKWSAPAAFARAPQPGRSGAGAVPRCRGPQG